MHLKFSKAVFSCINKLEILQSKLNFFLAKKIAYGLGIYHCRGKDMILDFGHIKSLEHTTRMTLMDPSTTEQWNMPTPAEVTENCGEGDKGGHNLNRVFLLDPFLSPNINI